jgi:quinol monooxygenase YgiN
MSNTVDIIAIITPAPGKADRVQQLLAETGEWVKANEPGTLRYHLQRETKGDSPVFVMLET